MKKFLMGIIFALCVLCGFHINNLFLIVANQRQVMAMRNDEYYEQMRYVSNDEKENKKEKEIIYDVYVGDMLEGSFEFYDEAVKFASDFANASIYENHTSLWVWDNFPPFELNLNNVRVMYSSYKQARDDAKNYEYATISFKNSSTIVWENDYINKGQHIIDVPIIYQLPELPRGCEVTSLAMLLNYKGVDIDKMALANEVEKHNNNPYYGFVGDMYNIANPGYGVYHGPIYNILHKYLPETAMDMTGCDFEDLYFLLDNNNPCWVVVNSSYNVLEPSSFIKWKTDDGNILITYSEHSVLVTGYDNDYIYFNDPLGRQKKAFKSDFISAWEQMGHQVVTTAINDN